MGRSPASGHQNIGYTTDQSSFKDATFATDPANANGNGGHAYGTGLTGRALGDCRVFEEALVWEARRILAKSARLR
jgi:hypothetical protein